MLYKKKLFLRHESSTTGKRELFISGKCLQHNRNVKKPIKVGCLLIILSMTPDEYLIGIS